MVPLCRTVAAADVPHIPTGTRAMLDWRQVSAESLSEALAIESLSGWRVLADYRPDGALILEGTDWRGDRRTMPVNPEHVRIER